MSDKLKPGKCVVCGTKIDWHKVFAIEVKGKLVCDDCAEEATEKTHEQIY